MQLKRARIKFGEIHGKGLGTGWFFVIACVLVTGAAAQEGRVFYAHGTEFTLFLGGQEEIYGPGVLNSSEISLRNGDIIRTGPESFLEFQLLPDGTGIKVAENTSIQITWREDRLPVISLSYGRIRVVTGSLALNPDLYVLYVQAGDGMVGIQNGDFCFDYVISAADSLNGGGGFLKPKLYLYDFRGFSEVTVAGNAEAGGSGRRNDWPVIPVNEGESVSLEVLASRSLVERKLLDRGIVEYWNRNNFQGTPPLPLPDTALDFGTAIGTAVLPAETLQPQAVPVPEPPYDFTGSQRRLTRIKNALLISGLTMTVAGIAAQAAGYLVLSPNDPAGVRGQIAYGFIPIGIGISAIVASLFFNPAFP
ncbi:MAG: FecR family protein [Treponema sp.]|nr:FecR family protein [Treponema sp.]